MLVEFKKSRPWTVVFSHGRFLLSHSPLLWILWLKITTSERKTIITAITRIMVGSDLNLTSCQNINRNKIWHKTGNLRPEVYQNLVKKQIIRAFIAIAPRNGWPLINWNRTIIRCIIFVTNTGTVDAFSIECAVVGTQELKNLFQSWRYCRLPHITGFVCVNCYTFDNNVLAFIH